MFCNRCGAAVSQGSLTCSNCGAPVAATNFNQPAAPRTSRVQKHRQILGILWCIIGTLTLLPALLISTVGVAALPFIPDENARVIAPFAMTLAAIFMFAVASIGLLVGIGLLKAWPWARIVAIVLGIIALPSVPFGTIMGIYTLWVLLGRGADEEYAALARG